MEVFGWIVISLILASAVAGAIAACRDDEKGLGKEFLEGIYAIGYIFLPVAGIMASAPFLTEFIKYWIAPLFESIGASPAIAATTFIAVDMGGYYLADNLAGADRQSWITAMTVGFMAGSTIVFSIPVGLAMLQKRDHKYLALGAMAGLLSIPIGVFVANLIIWMINPAIRPRPATGGPTQRLLEDMSLLKVLGDLAPLTGIMIGLALGLKFFPNLMIRLFMGFGRFMGIFVKIIVVLCIVQYFTLATFKIGLFTWLFGWWGFDPLIVDADQAKFLGTIRSLEEVHLVRALEVAGYIGLMLAGAFPMVYLLRKYLSKPIEAVGRKIGLDSAGAAGMLAAAANILAMFRLVKDMRPRDKVLCIGFAVCAAFTFGDHLAFTTNFQPNLLLPIIVGKLTGGVCGFLIATWLCVPKALELEKLDVLDDARTILHHVPALKGKSLVISPLGGGMTNKIYKVDDVNESYVLRVFGQGTELLGINREREVACSKAVAAVDLGAEVVAFLPELSPPPFEGFCGALLVRFLPGKLLETNQVQNPDILRRIAETLKQCHAAPVDETIATFSVFHTIRDYLDKARERDVALPAELGDALVYLHRIEKALDSNEPLCLCHNDLLAGNFVDDGQTLRIIDWEYGGRGNRFFDLGNFAASLQLTDEQEKAFLQAYFGEIRPEQLQRLKLMRLVSDLREASWGYLQAALSKLHTPQYYLDYGRRHLDRFLAAAPAAGLDK